MPTSSREAVRDFLQRVKAVVSGPQTLTQYWELVPRRKNLDFIVLLGFTRADVRDTILGLSVGDYCEGPAGDRDEPGYVWVFGTVLGGKETYIKLKLVEMGAIKVVRLISFHEADQPLSYPFK